LGYIRIWDLYDVIVFDALAKPIHEWTQELKDGAKLILAQVHASGHLHGDIKSDHFMRDHNQLVLIDFGLASKSVDQAAMRKEMPNIDCF